MGSGSSKRSKKENEERLKHRKMLMRRKVTTDLLEKLARSLPKVSNPLSKSLRLENNNVAEVEWEANLLYLEKWKLWKRDEATIGNLIALLKKAGFKPDVWECLFNISREPKNATTTMDVSDEFLTSASANEYECMRRHYPLYRVSPMSFQNDCFRNSRTSSIPQHQSTTPAFDGNEVLTANNNKNNQHSLAGVPLDLMHQRIDRYPQESMMDDVLRYHDNKSHIDGHNSAVTKSSSFSKTPNIHSVVSDP